jgi:hypothetical protein
MRDSPACRGVSLDRREIAELTDFGAMSTSSTVRLSPRCLGCPISTRLKRDFLIRSGKGWLDQAAGPRCPAGVGLPYVEESVPCGLP